MNQRIRIWRAEYEAILLQTKELIVLFWSSFKSLYNCSYCSFCVNVSTLKICYNLLPLECVIIVLSQQYWLSYTTVSTSPFCFIYFYFLYSIAVFELFNLIFNPQQFGCPHYKTLSSFSWVISAFILTLIRKSINI